MSNSSPFLKCSIGLILSSGLSLLSARADAALLVGNTRGNNVVIYSDAGNFGGDFIAPTSGGLLDPDDLTFGPDGNLYISSGSSSSGKILRYNGKTGDFIDEFVSTNLIRPYGNAFGPDGNLYVSSFLTDQIIRYDGKTGAFIDVFAAATGTRESGKLNGPNDLLFTPDGRLLVTTQGSVGIPDPDKPGSFRADFSGGFESQVLSYDIKTGESKVLISQPTPSPDIGFVSFLGLELGPQGDLFVSDFASDIRSYDLKTGTFKETISTKYQMASSSFGNLTLDPSGNLYTVGFDNKTNNGTVLRYDSDKNRFPLGRNSSAIFVTTNGNLKRPIGITYVDIEVPEPSTMVGLAAVSLLGVSVLKRRKSAIGKPDNGCERVNHLVLR